MRWLYWRETLRRVGAAEKLGYLRINPTAVGYTAPCFHVCLRTHFPGWLLSLCLYRPSSLWQRQCKYDGSPRHFIHTPIIQDILLFQWETWSSLNPVGFDANRERCLWSWVWSRAPFVSNRLYSLKFRLKTRENDLTEQVNACISKYMVSNNNGWMDWWMDR